MPRTDRVRQCIDEIVRLRGVVLLDGGLATELERRGYDLDDPLWSAKVLLEEPAAIKQLHRDYLEAGADCIITASYQASPRGFRERGLTTADARRVLSLSVKLAESARTQVPRGTPPNRDAALIAASIGPFGAYLHDGSEYSGNYSIGADELVEFHRERMEVLAHTNADLFACETIPSLAEAVAILGALRNLSDIGAWFSFTCQDDRHTTHGESVEECAAALADERVLAIGINCTAPKFLAPLVTRLRSATTKPIVVYPNSGEQWDASDRCWRGSSDPGAFVRLARTWKDAGATMIGGCCRTGPEHIRALSESLVTGR